MAERDGPFAEELLLLCLRADEARNLRALTGVRPVVCPAPVIDAYHLPRDQPLLPRLQRLIPNAHQRGLHR